MSTIELFLDVISKIANIQISLGVASVICQAKGVCNEHTRNTHCCSILFQLIHNSSFFLQVIIVILIKKKQREKIHGVHDSEHKQKQQTATKEKTQGTSLREERNSMIEEQLEEPQHLD